MWHTTGMSKSLDRTYRPSPPTATDRINQSFAEDGLNATFASLQDRISLALKETPHPDEDPEWVTFKIPSGSEQTFRRSLLEEALAETDPFQGL